MNEDIAVAIIMAAFLLIGVVAGWVASGRAR